MSIPLYAELLANIQVIRATIALDESIDPSLLIVENNQLWLEDTLILDLADQGVRVSPSSLSIQPADSMDNARPLYEIKLKLLSPVSTLEDKQWWTAKSLLSQKWQHIKCRHCDHDLVDNKSFKCKELPSEHWYELVECWICHEAKPEEHRARMQPILAKTGVLLVGAFYFLVHSADLHSVALDQEIASQVDVSC
jgi:hypothetical protein